MAAASEMQTRPSGDRIPDAVRRASPTIWANPALAGTASVLPGLAIGRADVDGAAARWQRFAPLLARLFPEEGAGRIDSPLVPLEGPLSRDILDGADGRVLVKADHALPVTGCIKARGGVYEVLAYAEELAMRAGLLAEGQSYAAFADPGFRALFARHVIAVGSTGNLGFSVGLMGRALGFAVEVHMSHDAKAWKKERLRELGARVVEHRGDYGAAVAAARGAFAGRADAHFVDDEDSVDLFLGYAAAALDLQRQLAEAGIAVAPARPLFVYLPCGVGGAPGGVAFGLKLLFGDAVHPVFVEPVASPCMLVQLAAGLDRSVSVYDVGLDNRTAADGLACASASMLVARTLEKLVASVVTVPDDALFRWLKVMWIEAGLRLEPSAAAGFAAAGRFAATLPAEARAGATHVIWTTGGAHLPAEEFEAALARG
ncbi:D-serine ammonia-lyase [Methylobacterium sp. NMS14P]|uniref:D-serine ammonia-lyase n=1 Tax=Methylobacterium sp. NMS14P TaxID=2894310 RepID=UPI002359410C|nr:D-serine ammonia-lyase [Methylobacterium sp. NMS14P]WCS25480.1 D-serine ammonia-lyase [Methylobacterium sp. NMS14P]